MPSRVLSGSRIGVRPSPLGIIIAVTFVVVGCVSLQGPVNDKVPVFEECPEFLASALASKDKQSKNEQLLYYTRLATIQQACREFMASAANFEKSKRLAEDLYTRSINAEARSLMLNDAQRPYPGENFERAFVRILNALNFAAVDRGESAMVEARQVDFFLRELNQKQGGKNVYNEDPFGRYLTGLLHENAGDLDSARISYQKALEAYSRTQSTYGVGIPPSLLASATAVAQRHGAAAQAEVRRYGRAAPRTLPAGAGEVVVVHQIGQIPDKVEEIISFGWNQGWAHIQQYNTGQRDAQYQQAVDIGNTLASSNEFQVAFPVFIGRPYRVRQIRVASPDIISTSRSELVADVGAIAKKDLADRIERIRARTITRAAVYFAIAEVGRQELQKENPGAAAAVSMLSGLRTIFLEHADRRQWDSMPDKIALTHVVLPAGTHNLGLEYLAGSSVARAESLEVKVVAGKRTFLVLRTAQ